MSRKRKDNIGNDDLEGYDSNFEDDESDDERKSSKRSKKNDLTKKEPAPAIKPTGSVPGLPTKEYFQTELTRAESYKNRYYSLNAYERHRKLINDYLLYHPGAVEKVLKRDNSKDKTDMDVIRENHRFLWNEDPNSWEQQLAKRYYDKLFKEYCICDLSRYKENKVAMRWRTEPEVVEGKGQFACGARKCANTDNLRTWEVNFAYMEESVKKNALVKLRLCPECSDKLNYGQKRKEVKKEKRKKHSHKRSSSSVSKPSTSRKSEPTATVAVNVKEEDISESPEENVWKEPLALPEMKSREEEFEEYLDDLFV